jgi:hypothetical protein
MQLEIESPELEALIAERLESGGSQAIEEILLRALSAAPVPEPPGDAASHRQTGRKSLAALFADSPFRGVDLHIERDEDTGRDLRL